MPIDDAMRQARKNKPQLAVGTIQVGTTQTFPPGYAELYEETADDLAGLAAALTHDMGVVRLMAPSTLTLRPLVTDKDGRILYISLLAWLSRQDLALVQKRAGALQFERMHNMPDIVVPSELGDSFPREKLNGVIPDYHGYASLNGGIIGLKKPTDPQHCKPETIHPFVFAYACNPEQRPLIAAAINRSVEDGRLEPPKPETPYDQALTLMKSYSLAAGEYIGEMAGRRSRWQDVGSAEAEINRVNELFLKAW